MGADAVALGTRFILPEENSDWHPNYLQALLDAKEGDDVAFTGVYGPCRGLRNPASEALLVAQNDPDADPVALIRHKIESMARAQTDGDTVNSLVMTGQVAGAISDVIRVAEFVPGDGDRGGRGVGQARVASARTRALITGSPPPLRSRADGRPRRSTRHHLPVITASGPGRARRADHHRADHGEMVAYHGLRATVRP